MTTAGRLPASFGTWKNIAGDGAGHLTSSTVRVVRKGIDVKKERMGMIMLGNPGTGKSHRGR